VVSKINKDYSIYAIENILPTKSGIYDLLDINNQFMMDLKDLQSSDGIKVSSSIQGRLDVVSMDKYGTTNLWWILAVYNNITNLRTFDVDVIKIPSIMDINKLIQKYKG